MKVNNPGIEIKPILIFPLVLIFKLHLVKNHTTLLVPNFTLVESHKAQTFDRPRRVGQELKFITVTVNGKRSTVLC